MAEEKSPQGLIASMLAGSGHTAQDDARADLAPQMYRGGKHLTMRTRLDRATLNKIHRARLAAMVMEFKPLESACDLMMELLVSENGLGRQEAVAMLRATYNTNIGGPSQDPALDG